MLKVWSKIIKNGKLLKDTTVEIDNDDTRTHKIFDALEKSCEELDLSNPIWLESNIAEFKQMDKTRFTSDSFVEMIDFDYLEFAIIEEN